MANSDPATQRDIERAWAIHAQRLAHPSLSARAKSPRGGERNLFLSNDLRDHLAGEQNWRCCYCGCRMDPQPTPRIGNRVPPNTATFEHVIPRSRGGRDTLSNLVICCQACNGARDDVMHPVHDEVLAMRPRHKTPAQEMPHAEDHRRGDERLVQTGRRQDDPGRIQSASSAAPAPGTPKRQSRVP